MSRYETYKPSGIEWIGEVPLSWPKKRIKDFYSSSMGETILQEDLIDEGLIPVYSATESDTIFGYVNNASVILEPGDIVIPARGNSIGNSKIVDAKSTCTQTTIYCKQNSSRILPKFIYYYNYGLKDFLFHYDNTAIPQITVKQVSNNPIFLPTIEEQLTIVSYLDDQTKKIDRLIANKKAQAEKLKELRQIEINNAVTKGLNPNAEMKDSGIEWLGEIPKHWEVKRLKNVANYIQTGITPPSENSDYYDGEIPWYGPGGFNGETILSNPAKYITQKAIDDNEAKLFPVNCVFMIGIGATIGKVGIIKEPSSCNQQLNIINFKSFVNPDFGVYFLKIYESVIINIANFSTLPIYNQVQTGNLKFLLPPKKEQDEIFDYLQKRTTAIDQLIKNIEAQIEKLQELRKIKIYEAVTGKIKVNAYAETTA